MKGFAVMLVVIALFLGMWLSREGEERNLPTWRLAEEGKSPPELVKVGDKWPLRAGTQLWFRPDTTTFGTVIETGDEMVRVRVNGGSENWIERSRIRNAFMMQSEIGNQ